MKNNRFTSSSVLLIFALLLAGISMYFNHQSSKRGKASKNELTSTETGTQNPLKQLVKENIQAVVSKSQTQEVHTESEAVELLTHERQYTEIELNEMTEEKFENLLKDTQMRLPKLSDIKKIPDGALHRTPTLVIEAGRNLGVIKEILRIHESFEKVAVPFYRDCAKNEQGSTPVRALCLTNLIELHKKNNVPLNLKEYPSQLIELTKLVTDI